MRIRFGRMWLILAASLSLAACHDINITNVNTAFGFGPEGGTLRVGEEMILTAVCPSDKPDCMPWWYSKDPSIVSVVGMDGEVEIDGVSWPAGRTARIRGVAPGTTDICAQEAINDQSILACHTFKVTN